MPATIARPRPPAPPTPGAGRPWTPPFAAESGDAWPRTNRWIPWLLAAFLAMLWLVPFDSTQVRVSLPLDPKLDRFLLTGMIVVWLASLFAGGRPAPRFRRSPLEAAVVVFAAVAAISVVLNIATLVNMVQTELALKKISLLLSYVTFFFIVATTLRLREVERFTKLFLGLASIASIGVLYEYFSGRNLFVEWWAAIVPDSAFVFDEQDFQNSVTGPARHALALAAMFGMALSFAVVYLARSRTAARQTLYAIAAVLMLGGVFATSRKTGSFAAIAACLTLLALRPREIARLLPVGVVVFTALVFTMPAAVEKQLENVKPGNISAGASGDARRSDYVAIIPDVRESVAIGRGYGTYDPHEFRVLDNNWLLLLVETGLIGVGAFAFVLIAALTRARLAMRSGDPARAASGLAVAGGVAAFTASMVLFDVLSFGQAPYMFFFLAGLVVVAGAPARRAVEPLPPITERLEEPLPPITERLEEPLPALQERLERERAAQRARREVEEHGGRPRRRRDRPERSTPVRPHVGEPLPGAPRDEEGHDAPVDRPSLAGARVRLRIGAARVRARAQRVSGRARGIAVGVLALGIAVLALGDGAGPDGDGGPRLGEPGRGDPLGLAEFDAPPEEVPARRGRGEPGRSEPAPAKPPATVPVADVDGGGAPPPASTPDRGERRGDDDRGGEERPRRRRPPRREPGVPGVPGTQPAPTDPEQPGGGDEAPQPAKDCLPGDQTEALLVGIGLEPCAQLGPTTGPQLRAAYESGRLTRPELDYLVDMLRRAQAAGAGEDTRAAGKPDSGSRSGGGLGVAGL